MPTRCNGDCRGRCDRANLWRWSRPRRHRQPRWEIGRQALIRRNTRKTIRIILPLRLSPLLPFETTNVLLAMTGVRPVPFIVGTMLGIAPRAAAMVWAGAAMRKLELH